MPKNQLLLVLVFAVYGPSVADAQSTTFPSAAELTPTVTATVAGDAVNGIDYSYKLSNASSSKQPAVLLAIRRQEGATVDIVTSPPDWVPSDPIGDSDLLGWGAFVDGEVKSATAQGGFVIRAPGLPGIVDAFVSGRVPIERQKVYPAFSAPDYEPGESVTENSIRLRILGPVRVPPVFDAPGFLQALIASKEEAYTLDWMDNSGIRISLDAKLNAARASLERQDSRTALNQLRALLLEVNAQSGQHITPEGVALLKFNTQYLIDRLR